MLIDKAVAWFAKRWAKDNLTEENISKGAKGLWEWLSDPLIKEALWRVVKFCLVEILREIQKKANEETDTNLPDPPCA
jgi:hypothetical protein